MWSSLNQISLTRYLFVCRVNRAMVRLPRSISAQLSLVLGETIAHRLPTAEARLWRKALAPWAEYREGVVPQVESKKKGKGTSTGKEKKKELPRVPEVSWPIEAILFLYPGKAMYGPGELILWELKLFGTQVDHGFFLEIILPALEELGSSSASPWYQQNSLWGRFDIQAVYAARGVQWEPVVSDGRLDLRYRATPTQWAEGLTFGLNVKDKFNTLTWLTPFDFTPSSGTLDNPNPLPPPPPKKIPAFEVPTLQSVLEAMIARIAQLLPGKFTTPDDVWNILSTQEQLALTDALEQAARMRVRDYNLEPVSKYQPGRWVGTQTFSTIPFSIVPYLELASILHLGRQTHFGCGTFIMS